MNYKEQGAAALDAAEQILTRTETELREFTDEETVEYDQLLARAERYKKLGVIEAAAREPANLEPGTAPGTRTRTAPDGPLERAARVLETNHDAGYVSDDVAGSVEHLLKVPGQRGVDMAAWVEAAGSNDYLAAFAKRMADPTTGHLNWTAEEADAWRQGDQYARTALSLSGASSMLPLSLDPTIALTNTGSTGGIRSVCRHEVTASNAWNGVTSAGATAEWKTEGSEAADGTPAVAGKNIPVYLLDVNATVSYEIEQDGLNFAAELAGVLFDAAAVAVDAALATGSGSGAPTGIITALTGSQQVLTAGAFTTAGTGVASVTNLQNAVPARFQHSAKFVAPLAVINTVGQFTTSNGSLVYPEVKQDQLLRRGLVEDSNISADVATSGSKFAVYGDWNQFLEVSRVGASIEILPAYGSSGRRPTAQHHYFLTLRMGSDALVPNAFRYLQKS